MESIIGDGGVRMDENVLEIRGLCKSFPGVNALTDIDLDVKRGEVHVLLGENGAGKSTLIKILTGAYIKDGGEIKIDGQAVDFISPQQAIEAGVGCVYQELNLVNKLSVMENVLLGRELLKIKRPRIVDWKATETKCREVLSRMELSGVDPKALVSSYGVGIQQLVEISKFLVKNVKILILDEPTSSLTISETNLLFNVIRKLKSEGVTILFISHKLEELFEIGDRITVLKDGFKVGTRDVKDTDEDELIRMMVGRTLSEKFPKIVCPIGEEMLRVEGLCRENVIEGISFSVHRGEVLGFAGLVGAGRTEMARVLFGADKKTAGITYIRGKPVHIKNPQTAIKNGMAFLTEDRKTQGLIMVNTAEFNINIAALRMYAKTGVMRLGKFRSMAQDMWNALQIRPDNMNLVASSFSGGNQQKLVIAKWLQTKADIFVFDEPTRGIDVNAKVEVYNIINDLVKNGAAVILISSEMPEILAMCDRIIVMRKGRITGELSRNEATEELIIGKAVE
jgi:ribose transport system ATP-binding protein